MPPSTSLRKTYSSLSPSLMSSDDFHSGGTKEMCMQPRRSSPRTISRHLFLISITIFALLEFGFIALVSAAIHNPIILNVSFTNTEVTGAVTTIAILWQALAIFVAEDILMTVFSAEWVKQYDRSRYLTLQEYDIVSRLTTGPMDKLKYFLSKRATLPFRLSLLAFLLLLLLSELGPGSIDVEPVPLNHPCTAPIANLTVGLPGDGTVETPASQLANAILQLEVVQNSATVGFKAKQPNILTPWPSSDFMSKNMSMTYQSDVIRYNFSCSWEIPSIKEDTWVVAGKEWPPYFTAGALPYWPVLSDPLIFPLWTMFNESTPLTALLFVGRNGTTPSYLNLADVPSLNLPCNTTRNPTYLGGTPRECNPVSVSVLMCDPQPEVLPATVNATAGFLETTILPGAPAVRNIPNEAANTLFSTSFLEATAQRSYGAERVHSSAFSHQLFLPNLTFDWGGANPLKPLSLDRINQNMNVALGSAAKAYLDGFKPNADNPTLSSFAKVNTTAVMKVRKLALVGSKPFLVVSSVLVGLVIAIIGVVVAITSPDQLESFELENIVKKLR